MAKKTLKIGTCKVRSLRGNGKLQLLCNEIKSYNCDILGLAEMQWEGKGELNNAKVIWSGSDSKATEGVGFLFNKRVRSAVTGYNQINSRIIAARFRGQPLNISAVQVFAPTSSTLEEEIKQFYN